MIFREYIKNNRILTDGAMGTYFSVQVKDDTAISEMANFTNPRLIEKIHNEYILAGAKLIRTNTFVAATKVLNLTYEQQKELIQHACEIAKEAVKQSGKQVYIAGSIGPISEGLYQTEDEILKEYYNIIDEFLKNDIDIILFETFSDLTYINQLVPYIKEKNQACFIITNFCFNKNGYTKAGVSANRILEKVSRMDEIEACGFNCGIGSGHMLELLQEVKLPTNKYIAMIPNASYPEQLQNRMVFLHNTSYFCDNMKQIFAKNISIIGGCCGTTPEYIKMLSNEITKWDQVVSLREAEWMETTERVIPIRENQFYQKLVDGKKVIAVELDPPFNADYESLMEHAQVAKAAGADIITLADSPMGRSRVDSILMSIKMKQDVNIPVMPHVCCRDKNMIAMRSSLLGAYVNGIRNLLVVTGDPVPSINRTDTTSVFDYNSFQLMSFLKGMNEEHFCEEPIYYGGALNYGRGNIEKVIKRMEKKIESGCSYFLTQPIYSAEDMERIRYIKSRVDTKILCGIMPFVSYRNANFVKNEITGIFVPDEIVNRYKPDMSREEAQHIGETLGKELMEQMSDFADGFYFMLPFNRVSMLSNLLETV